MEERDEDCLRAHLRVERNGVEEGEICDLGESALDMVGMVWEERDTDWELAHLRVERNEWGREMPTGRGRT